MQVETQVSLLYFYLIMMLSMLLNIAEQTIVKKTDLLLSWVHPKSTEALVKSSVNRQMYFSVISVFSSEGCIIAFHISFSSLYHLDVLPNDLEN